MKMSDALRGAAETAPVEHAHVSVSTVRSRSRRNRALRAAANGVAGVGAAGLVVAGVAGVLGSGLALAAADAGTSDREGVTSTSGGEPEPAAAPPVASACGSTFERDAWVPSTVTATVAVQGPAEHFVPAVATLTAGEDGTYAIGMPDVYLLWEDTVVAQFTVAAGPDAWTAAAGDITTVDVDAELWSCWGTDFPAGEYSLVAVIPVTPAGDALTYAVTDPVAFTVAGDPVANPFGDELSKPTPVNTSRPSPAPDTLAGPADAVTAQQARAAFDSALVGGRWDMAPGTQRVVKTADSADASDAWAASYYGCAGGGTAPLFPERSASLRWLDVSASLPRTINVSYGWVVDGNPLVSVDFTNATSWSLPGFFSGGAPRLVLVKDGRVAAEAYPVDPNGPIGYATDGEKAASAAYDPAQGYLAPGASLTGDYLWRDIDACWSDAGPSTVTPGTYTVLSARDIGIGGGAVAPVSGAAREGGQDGFAAGGAQPDIAPVNDDFVSFTVWTSLGTVTITN